MKYFKICSEYQGNLLPVVKNWMEKLDYHTVKAGEISKLPRRTLLYVENHEDTLFADIIDAPFFLVSDMVWKVMKLYDESIQGNQIVLLDDVFGIVKIYHMPMLTELDPVLWQQEQKNAPPFFVFSNIKGNSMIGRLDFVESILRRAAQGIKLVEI